MFCRCVRSMLQKEGRKCLGGQSQNMSVEPRMRKQGKSTSRSRRHSLWSTYVGHRLFMCVLLWHVQFAAPKKSKELHVQVSGCCVSLTLRMQDWQERRASPFEYDHVRLIAIEGRLQTNRAHKPRIPWTYGFSLRGRCTIEAVEGA